MFSLFEEGSKDSDSEGTDRRPPLQGPDIKAMEKILKPSLKPSLRKLVHEDDSEGLEEVLEAERSANPKPPAKKNKKKSGKGQEAGKEDDEFAILGRRILHFSCALDAVECCKLLITSQTFPRVWVDAVDEVDQRSALHVASQNHSRRCIEVLLKQGANVALRNKQQTVPLEEALLSSKLHVDWDFLTPAAQIVEKVREKDLVALRALEAKCKDLLVPVAFKLAKGLKLVPLVALLIVARGSFVVNSVAKKIEGEEDSVGTLVDLLLGKAIAYSSVSSLDKSASRCKKSLSEGLGEPWSGETSRILRKGSCEADGSGVDAKYRRNSGDWESPGETKHRYDLEEGCSEIKHRKDLSEWEEITSKYRSNGTEGESSVSDSKFRRTSSGGDMDRAAGKHVEDKCSAGGEDLETNCKTARKLLECVLLFGPRLSAHPQSPSLPPLLRAAQANDEILLSLLLEAGAPINETDSDGNTALHWALRQATPVNKRSVNSKLVKRLLDASANVLLGNKLGATPVHTAAGHGHYEALSLILEKEAGGVNVMAATKETPLHYSVKNNHLLCTAILLTHGANRNVSSLRSQKPYQLAPSPEMRALLSMDEANLREQSWESLFQTLALAAQQQVPPMCTDNGPAILPLSFSQAAAQPPPMSQIRSQFHCPPVVPHSSGVHPLSFSQSLSIPSLQDHYGQPHSQVKSSQHFQLQPALRHHMSLPAPHESNPAWNANCLALQKAVQKQVLNGMELSQVGDGDLTNGKSNVNLPAYKTVLCRFFGTSEGCGWGNKCHFAHSEEELIAGQQKLKTAGEKIEGGLTSRTMQICPDAGDQGVKNFKTKLCMHHEKMGTCPHGSKCKFAHGEGELRPLSSSSSVTPTVRSGPRPSTSSSLTSSGSEEDDTSIRKVFVGGLPHFIHSEELWEFFESEFGKVVDAVVICGNDEEGKPRSRGFGFVLFAEQKDADEAVRRHYFPFRGKKVEVKRAQARLDSPSGDEAGKMTSCFSSGISSPAAPQSPALPSTMPGVNLFNDGMQLPSSIGIGAQPVWSLPPLSVDTPQEGVQNSPLFAQNRGHLLAQNSLQFLSEHNGHPHHLNGGLSASQNSGLLPTQDGGQFYQNNQPYPTGRDLHHTVSQPVARSPRPQIETSLVVPKAYSDPSPLLAYSSSPVKTTVPPTLSTYSNGSVSHNSTSHHPFSYYVDDNSQSYFSAAPPTSSQTSDTNQGAEDEELSQLLELLKAPSNHSSSQPRIPTTVSSTSSSTVTNRGGHQVFSTQNGGKEAASMYSRESLSHLPYTGASQARNNYSGASTQLPEGFKEFPSSAKYKEVGQTSNGVGYTTNLPNTLGYSPQPPVGSKVASDSSVLNSSGDLAAYRGVMGAVGGAPSNVMSVLLPGFSNSQQGPHLYDSNHLGTFDSSR